MGGTVYTYVNCRKPGGDEPYKPNPQYSPERLSNIRLKNRLCASGPKRCSECRGCESGLEWLRRHPEGGKIK